MRPSTRRWSIAGAIALLASAPVQAQSSFASGTPLDWSGVLPGAVARAVPELTRAITASAGITDVDAGIGVADALKAADLNLYLAKASGRDRSQGLAPFTITPSAPRSVAAAA